jgi:Uma2 family endonuclease
MQKALSRLSSGCKNMTSRTFTNATTADELFALSGDGIRRELVNGDLIMMSPAGSEHGRIALRIGGSLGRHVDEHRLGVAFAAETGFVISENPDTVRAPDASFVSKDVMANLEPIVGYLPIAPTLAVEVVSPSDSFSDIEDKVSMWLDAGTKIVLVANPSDQTLRVYRSANEIQVLRAGQVFVSGDVCGNWQLSVDEVFRA